MVVKVGSSSLTRADGGLDLNRIDILAGLFAGMRRRGHDIVLVSSGAVASGLVPLGLSRRPDELSLLQAAASVGQGRLAARWETAMSAYGLVTAQVLLTAHDVAIRSHYRTVRATFDSLLSLGAVPIINENDAVAVDEIKIGDNDNLSAVVAALVDADALIILSDIDGVYTSNPRTDSLATLISEIPEITPEIERIAGGAGSAQGTGGMQTKIEAAKIAQNAGVTMVIACGDEDGTICSILRGEEVGTLFPAREAHLRTRKSWLAFGKHLAGELVVDAGCVDAMRHGASLLAVGVTSVYGDFAAGETVRVLSSAGQEIARGITAYNAADIACLMGHQTEEFHVLVKDSTHEEIIHRDNLVLMV